VAGASATWNLPLSEKGRFEAEPALTVLGRKQADGWWKPRVGDPVNAAHS